MFDRFGPKTTEQLCQWCVGNDAEQMHAAADSGYQESAQLMDELLLKVLAGYRDIAPHGMVISLTDASADDHKAGNPKSMDARAFTHTYTAASEVRDGRYACDLREHLDFGTSPGDFSAPRAYRNVA
jgi:hypothetical protein